MLVVDDPHDRLGVIKHRCPSLDGNSRFREVPPSLRATGPNLDHPRRGNVGSFVHAQDPTGGTAVSHYQELVKSYPAHSLALCLPLSLTARSQQQGDSRPIYVKAEGETYHTVR